MVDIVVRVNERKGERVSVLVVGMSHRSAPVALLEKLSMDDGVRTNTVSDLVARPSLAEAMIVSTCNRLEVYAMTSSFHTGVNDVVEVLHDMSGVDMEELRGYLYVRYADAAAEHMMEVTSGLDSMVVGEQQIIGQVRTAYHSATEAGTVGPALHGLVQASLHTGKRVHTETDIDDAGASMVSFACDEALAQMSATNFAGCRALVLGAGAMASLAATHLGRLGIEHITVANRTFERAQRLADHAVEAGVSASAIEFERRMDVLCDVDMVVSATGANTFTIEAANIPAAHGDLMMIDLSLPRDISDDVAEVSGVRLVNIEKLRDVASSGEAKDHAAQRIVAEELEAYTSAQRIRDVVPAVAALRRHASSLIDSELARLSARVPGMDEDDFSEVQRTVRRVVDKLLHQPTVRVKEFAAQSGTVSYDTAIQELFGLAVEATPVAVNVDELPERNNKR